VRKCLVYCLLLLVAFLGAGCPKGSDDGNDTNMERRDSAVPLPIALSGSLQNGAWSPAADAIVLTRFRSGYNAGPADLYTYALTTQTLHLLVSDGNDNVNLPGACWNPVARAIVFASSRDPHDEIFRIDDTGSPGEEVAVTSRNSQVGYEPSFSPDGQWVVFESHPEDVEAQGIITKHHIDSTLIYQALTDSGEDCRQPNWAPAGDHILYQKLAGEQWDIWVMNIDGTGRHQVTTGSGDKTDASFSPDGRWIVFSSDQEIESANLFVIPVEGGTAVRVTNYDGYDGAPSWSSDGRIVFETFPGDPDDSEGTTLWVINAPTH
jgi:TolB protein